MPLGPRVYSTIVIRPCLAKLLSVVSDASYTFCPRLSTLRLSYTARSWAPWYHDWPVFFLGVGSKGLRIPSNQLKLAYIERIEKLARANGYCVRRHSNEQRSLRVKRHVVVEGSRLLVGAELLAMPAARRDAMSAKCLATSRSTQSKILQACRSLI